MNDLLGVGFATDWSQTKSIRGSGVNKAANTSLLKQPFMVMEFIRSAPKIVGPERDLDRGSEMPPLLRRRRRRIAHTICNRAVISFRSEFAYLWGVSFVMDRYQHSRPHPNLPLIHSARNGVDFFLV